jgi:SAM-dependent methyltransferase
MGKATYEQRRQPEGFTSAHPPPTTEELQKFYADMYYQAPQSSSYQESYDDLDLRYKRLKCDSLLHAVAQLGGRRATFLDIGAGEGFLMAAAQAHGYAVNGLDFSAFGVSKFNPSMADKLIVGDIYEGLAGLVSANRHFDVCSTINVLEHVIDPDLFLGSVRRVMAPDGVLAITVPNDFSRLQQMLLRDAYIDREFWYAPPHHLHYFNTENLVTYLTSRGFTVVDAFSDFPVDLYLLHPGSNYIMNPTQGKAAHRARMIHDVLIAEVGMPKYLDYYRAMFAVGIGRDVTVIVHPTTDQTK